MKQTYDIEATMFGILKGTSALTAALSGGIYAGERPLNSEKEDVAINTIALSQDFEPQLGTSNVNIHVPDKKVTIGGIQQNVEDRARLKALSDIVLTAIRGSKVAGLKIVVENQATLNEPEIKQHYVNIRVNWIIH
jgi:hypothetical protein